MSEPLTQLEFVELLSTVIDEGVWFERAAGEYPDSETVENVEMHQFEVTVRDGIASIQEMRGRLHIRMKNGQRWRITVEEIR